MKRNILIISIIILTFILLSILSYSILFKNVYHMDEKIFDISNISNISIKNEEKTFIMDNDKNINELLKLIKGEDRKTRNQSVTDAPNGEKIILVDINYIDKNYKRIYVYKYENKYYLESPYEGKYNLSENDYNLIEDYLK